MKFRLLVTLLLSLYLGLSSAYAGGNGKLQIHFIDVGQGDAALLVSPQGETIMFDNGNSKACEKPLAYLESIGIQEIDYHVATHYHADHIGCASQVFSQVKLTSTAFDRGHSYSSAEYKKYLSAIKGKRATVQIGRKLVLDKETDSPVKVTFVAANGSTGDSTIKTTNENDLSIAALIEFGDFRAEIGGDLSGEETGSYKDVETSVAKKVGRIDVYKVHHHCSAYSTNNNWLATTTPTVGIISVGVENNIYGHPAENCLDRLRQAGVKLYWTELGNGAKPNLHQDKIAGDVLVEVAPAAKKYMVTYQGDRTDTYTIGPPLGNANIPMPASLNKHLYAWAKSAKVYHDASCPVVSHIKSENLITGYIAPPGKRKHDCQDNH